MAIRYFGEHSITFVEYDTLNSEIVSRKNTWTDFHLVPTERPTIGVPSPKYTLVPIPGTNKIFDATEYMPGGLTFSRRTGQWSFNIDNEQWENWYDAKNALEAFINGKRLYCVLEDDPDEIYYLGTFVASGWDDGEEYSQVTISYEIDYEGIDIATSESDFAFVQRGYPIHKWFSDEYKKNIGVKYLSDSYTILAGQMDKFPIPFDSPDEEERQYTADEYDSHLKIYDDNSKEYSLVMYIYDDLNTNDLYFEDVWVYDDETHTSVHEENFDIRPGYLFEGKHIAFDYALVYDSESSLYKFIFDIRAGADVQNVSFHYRLFIVPWNGGG